MPLTDAKIRAVANLLSDPLQAHAASSVLAAEAKERGVLIADLIAAALAPAVPAAPPPPPRSQQIQSTSRSASESITPGMASSARSAARPT